MGFIIFIWRWLKSGRTKEELLEMISEERDLVIVCDEIGCGLVPVDAFEREYREAVGRIMTGLTKKGSSGRPRDLWDRICYKMKRNTENDQRKGGKRRC